MRKQIQAEVRLHAARRASNDAERGIRDKGLRLKLVTLQLLRPAELVALRSAFDDPRFIFELKQDGFRALAHIEHGQCSLISRRGNVYKSFQQLASSLASLGCSAILDGEIVVLDADGRPRFYDLLRRRGDPILYAFDLLWLDGEDLCSMQLLQRKQLLERTVRGHPAILYAQHVQASGVKLFDTVCEQDLEGVVAKRADAPYGEDWFKIRNPAYSQYEGRRELFERRVARASA